MLSKDPPRDYYVLPDLNNLEWHKQPQKGINDGWIFTPLPRGIAQDRGISDGAVRCYIYLRLKSGEDGQCEISLSAIGQDMGRAEETVYGYIKDLKAAGYLCVDRRPGRTNRYYLGGAE